MSSHPTYHSRKHHRSIKITDNICPPKTNRGRTREKITYILPIGHLGLYIHSHSHPSTLSVIKYAVIKSTNNTTKKKARSRQKPLFSHAHIYIYTCIYLFCDIRAQTTFGYARKLSGRVLCVYFERRQTTKNLCSDDYRSCRISWMNLCLM